MLTPTVDHLFDKGFIGFEDSGRLIISPVADEASLTRMSIPAEQPYDVGSFTSGQKAYLAWHRDNILLT